MPGHEEQGAENALRARLEAAIGAEAGAPVQVSAPRQLAGGASQEAWSLDMEIAGGPYAGRHALVLRRDLGGALSGQVLTRQDEYAVLRAAHAAGIPVPRPWWYLPPGEAPGRAAFLMERIAGETIGRRLVREPALAEARAVLPAQLGAALAGIHALPVGAALAFLRRPAPGQSAGQMAIAGMTADLDALDEPHPALELGLRWLARHDPGPGELVLVHGDFRIGNFIVGTEGLRAVLDWENTHLGDPHEDLAWIGVRAWRFGYDHLPVGGIGERTPFHAAYTQASGRPVDPARVFYWEVAGNMRWALGALGQARRHLSGKEPSIELASLGRIAAEMELELLRLIAMHGEGEGGGDAR